MLPMMMARADEVFSLDISHLKWPISQQITDQVLVTTSVIFIDYPYAKHAKGREFLDRIALAPADMAKLTHRNAGALLRLKTA